MDGNGGRVRRPFRDKSKSAVMEWLCRLSVLLFPAGEFVLRVPVPATVICLTRADAGRTQCATTDHPLLFMYDNNLTRSVTENVPASCH